MATEEEWQRRQREIQEILRSLEPIPRISNLGAVVAALEAAGLKEECVAIVENDVIRTEINREVREARRVSKWTWRLVQAAAVLMIVAQSLVAIGAAGKLFCLR